MSTPDQHFDAARKFQAYYDETLRKVGMRAPEPTLGQTVNDYRRETLRTLKRTFLPQVHDLYQVQFRELKADALGVLEPQLLDAVVVEANNPVHVPLGELRKVEELDEFARLIWAQRCRSWADSFDLPTKIHENLIKKRRVTCDS